MGMEVMNSGAGGSSSEAAILRLSSKRVRSHVERLSEWLNRSDQLMSSLLPDVSNIVSELNRTKSIC